MTTIVILIAYWFDYVSNKKRFILDLKGGILFLSLLILIFVFISLILNLGIVYASLTTGVVIPVCLFVKHLAKK